MKRRITAVFMALCIAMTLLPMSALAEEPAGETLTSLTYFNRLYEYSPVFEEYIEITAGISVALATCALPESGAITSVAREKISIKSLIVV